MSDQSITKTCRVCKQTKPITEFYEAPSNHDGHEKRCKVCHLRHCRAYQKTKRGKMKHNEANHRYGKTEKNKNCQKRYRQSKKGQQSQKRYRAENPEKRKASQAVMVAVRTGDIPRPDVLNCFCGEQAKEYHHPSYKPEHQLDVIALCIPCHKKFHSI